MWSLCLHPAIINAWRRKATEGKERELGARIISTDANDFACIGFYRGHEGLRCYGLDDELIIRRVFCRIIV